jgi:hypothetical protein
LAILELKAAWGWSLAQVARAFLVKPDTSGPGSEVRSRDYDPDVF